MADNFAVCVKTLDDTAPGAYRPWLGRREWSCAWPFYSFRLAEEFCRERGIGPDPARLDAVDRPPSILVPYSKFARLAMEAAVMGADATLTRYAEMGQPSLR